MDIRKGITKAVFTTAALLLAGGPALAEGAVAVTSLAVPAGTDTRVSVPVTQDAVGSFTITGVSGNTATLDGAAFDEAEFPANASGSPLFYARFTSGALEGRWFNIVGNAADSVDLNAEDSSTAADLSSAEAGDSLEIYPHWTFDALFPIGMEGLTFTASTNPFVPSFSVLLPDNDGVGINRPAATSLFVFNGQWVLAGGVPAGSTVVAPQQTLILRNDQPTSTGEEDDPGTVIDESTNDLIFATLGDVPLTLLEQVPVQSIESDTTISAGNLATVKISELNLESVVDESLNPFVPTDSLFFFPEPNAANGLNVPAGTQIFRFNGSFVFPGGLSADDFEVGPGAVFILRKGGGTPGSVDWDIPNP